MGRTEVISALGNLAWILVPEPYRVSDRKKRGSLLRGRSCHCGQDYSDQATPRVIGEEPEVCREIRRALTISDQLEAERAYRGTTLPVEAVAGVHRIGRDDPVVQIERTGRGITKRNSISTRSAGPEAPNVEGWYDGGWLILSTLDRVANHLP